MINYHIIEKGTFTYTFYLIFFYNVKHKFLGIKLNKIKNKKKNIQCILFDLYYYTLQKLTSKKKNYINN